MRLGLYVRHQCDDRDFHLPHIWDKPLANEAGKVIGTLRSTCPGVAVKVGESVTGWLP